MRKGFSILGSALFLFIAPGTFAGWVPWWISHWQVGPAFPGIGLVRIAGAVLILLGSLGLLDSFARFALQGLGTPAPVFPTRHLVITGLYRYVRNPMYVSMTSTILGQGLFFANEHLVAYGLLFWVLTHLFVLLYEEPKLRASFGSEYSEYCRGVRRWVPRLRGWRSDV